MGLPHQVCFVSMTKNPLKSATVIAIVFLFTTSLLTATPAGANSVLGDLVVEGDDVVVYEQTTVTVHGNVIVRGGGTLILSSANLVLDQGTNYQFGVTVRDSGTLILEDGSALLSNQYYRTTIRDTGNLVLDESAIRGPTATNTAATELVIMHQAHVEASGADFVRVWTEFRGDSTGSINDSTLVGISVADRVTLESFNDAHVEITGSELAMGFRNLQGHGDSTLIVRDSVLRGHGPPFANNNAHIIVEDSVWGVPGSIITPFWYHRDTPTVEYRNVQFLQNHYMILQTQGDFLFHNTDANVPNPDDAFGLQSTASTIRIEGSNPSIGTVSLGLLSVGADSNVDLNALEIDQAVLEAGANAQGAIVTVTDLVIEEAASATLHLGQADGIRAEGDLDALVDTAGSIRIGQSSSSSLQAQSIRFLDVQGALEIAAYPADEDADPLDVLGTLDRIQTDIEYLIARDGSQLSLQGDPLVLVQAVQYNNECGSTALADLGGLGAALSPDPRQTIRVSVTSGGVGVAGATVSLSTLLGGDESTYDPDADDETPTRTTDADGIAEFLFAPTGLVTVSAEAGGTQSSENVLALSCEDVEIEL